MYVLPCGQLENNQKEQNYYLLLILQLTKFQTKNTVKNENKLIRVPTCSGVLVEQI